MGMFFVIINGVEFDTEGEIVELETPYPGSNLFSLASGGAIYVRDPHNKLSESTNGKGGKGKNNPLKWLTFVPYPSFFGL